MGSIYIFIKVYIHYGYVRNPQYILNAHSPQIGYAAIEYKYMYQPKDLHSRSGSAERFISRRVASVGIVCMEG